MEVKKNNFLENFSKEKKPLVFYLLGSLIVLIFSILGQTPMFFFLPNEINTYSNGLGVFSSLDKIQPCPYTVFGKSIPAANKKAGQ